MATGTAPNLDIGGVRSEVNRIVKANRRHFHALSAIFLFPLSLFCVCIYLTLLSVPNIQIKTLALPLIFSPFVFNILSLFAVGTITYSTYQGFYNRPLSLVASIKSLLYTFMPLAATTIVSVVILIPIAAAFAVIVGLVSRGVELLLGYEIFYYYHNYFTGFCTLVLVLYIQVNWSLASVIVVVESKWGMEALRRSKYLVRGMRWVSFLLMFMYGSFIVFYVWANTGSGKVNLQDSSSSFWWMRYLLVVQALLSSYVVAILILIYMAALQVLYVYCKVTHGELAAWEVAEESAREYVSLPFEDAKKVPLLVDVVAQV